MGVTGTGGNDGGGLGDSGSGRTDGHLVDFGDRADPGYGVVALGAAAGLGPGFDDGSGGFLLSSDCLSVFGRFLMALAMERWGLHRRVAFGLIGVLGLWPGRIVGGFLLASAALSMWVSNTATALMMLPIAISVTALVPEDRRGEPAMKAFAVALMLAVAYGATTGGMATLIGTPPNARWQAL
ncbi:MAG: anion permease [Candidatus Synoicihabitans palmerolidicus]|nr:anion permease [Candidatus Synoicihabitans palmerolidicus]